MKKVLAKNKLYLGLVLLLLMGGCGLKANPAPKASGTIRPQSVPVFTAQAVGPGVVLTWRLENSAGRIRYLNIEKSQLGFAENACRDCPRTFARVARFAVHEVQEKYSFTDAFVEKGKLYSYRLKLCDETDICRESQTIEIAFP